MSQGLVDTSDFYSGAGGGGQGLEAIPGVRVTHAANHWKPATDTYAANFPNTDVYRGDLRTANLAQFPYVELHLDAPECTKWSQSRGKKRDYAMDPTLFDDPSLDVDEETTRSRMLMQQVPAYLEYVRDRYGKPVLAGITENVVDVYSWTEWSQWVGRFKKMGYHTRLIALNSAHAQPIRTSSRPPQSRDRLYFAYWHESIGREPDWDKWLRPAAWCDTCDKEISAVQVFKKPGQVMGKYGIGNNGQYVYRCPHLSCRNQIVEPYFLPAGAIIDWTDLGRPVSEGKLADATRARILAGVNKFAQEPIIWAHAGHTFERRPGVRTWSMSRVLPAQTASATMSMAVPLDPAFIMRNNTERTSPGHMSTSVGEPLRTLTTKGAQTLVTWQEEAARQLALLVPYYKSGVARPVSWPTGALSTKDRYGLAVTELAAEYGEADLDRILYRMLKIEEIAAAMAFEPGYILVAPRHQDKVKLLGNAITPPVIERIASALVECIRGETLDLAA